MKLLHLPYHQAETESPVVSEETKHGRNAWFILLAGAGLAANTEMVANAESAGVVLIAAIGAAAVEGKRSFTASRPN